MNICGSAGTPEKWVEIQEKISQERWGRKSLRKPVDEQERAEVEKVFHEIFDEIMGNWIEAFSELAIADETNFSDRDLMRAKRDEEKKASSVYVGFLLTSGYLLGVETLARKVDSFLKNQIGDQYRREAATKMRVELFHQCMGTQYRGFQLSLKETEEACRKLAEMDFLKTERWSTDDVLLTIYNSDTSERFSSVAGEIIALAARKPTFNDAAVNLLKGMEGILKWTAGNPIEKPTISGRRAGESFRHAYANAAKIPDEVWDSVPVDFWVGLKSTMSWNSKGGKALTERLFKMYDEGKLSDGASMYLVKSVWLGGCKAEVDELIKNHRSLNDRFLEKAFNLKEHDGVGGFMDFQYMEPWRRGNGKKKWLTSEFEKAGYFNKESTSQGMDFANRGADGVLAVLKSALTKLEAEDLAKNTLKANSKQKKRI